MMAPRQRVGKDFDKLVRMMQQNLEPVIGRKPTYPETTNSIGCWLMDERLHERMIRRAAYLHKGRHPKRLF